MSESLSRLPAARHRPACTARLVRPPDEPVAQRLRRAARCAPECAHALRVVLRAVLGLRTSASSVARSASRLCRAQIGPSGCPHRDQSDRRAAGRVKPNSGTSRGRIWDDLHVPRLLLRNASMPEANQGALDVSTPFWDACKRPKRPLNVLERL